MAQTGYTPIQLYYSTTASAVPTAGNLASGELAINITDGKLYYKNNSGTVTLLAGSGGGGPAAGSNTQIQFNSSGVFGASSSLTWDGTYLTAGSIKDSALTSGRVTFAGASGLLTDDADLTFDGTTLSTAGLTASGTVTLSGGTANGVTYLNGSKQLVSGSALTFDGDTFSVSGTATLAGSFTSTSANGTALRVQNNGANKLLIGSVKYITGGSASEYGIGASGDNPIVFATNDIERMRLNSTGLGIGTSSFSEKLRVEQTAVATVAQFRKSSVANVVIGYNGTSVNYNDVDTQYWRTAAASDLMALTSTGLGIGTSSLVSRLTVKASGSTYSTGSLALVGSSSGTSYITNAGGTLYVSNDGSTDQLVLNSAGNLGIGTSSPAQLLDVQSATSPTIRISNSKEWASGDSGVIAAYQFYTKDASTPNGTKIAAYINSENYAGSSVPEGILTFGTSAGGGSSTNATEKMRLDSAGNLGLGVTPSAWRSNYKAIQAGNGAAFSGATSGNTAWMGSNWYVNSSNVDTYIGTGQATVYAQASGQHLWYTAPSGTAGNAISFTQAMTLDASGNLGVGVTSMNYPLTVAGASNGNTITAINNSSNISRFCFAQYGTPSNTYTNIEGDARSTGYLAFRTNDTERARIDSSGNFCYGVQSFSAANNGFLVSANGASTYTAHANGTSSGATYSYFYYNNSEIGSITQSGTTAVLYNTTSDQRLKENIQDADSASSLIDSLQVRKFDWKSDGSHQRYGFVAQELVTVAPEAVHQPTDTEQMMAVDYSKLVPMLVKEIQSLRQRVAQLETN